MGLYYGWFEGAGGMGFAVIIGLLAAVEHERETLLDAMGESNGAGMHPGPTVRFHRLDIQGFSRLQTRGYTAVRAERGASGEGVDANGGVAVIGFSAG